MIAKIGPESAYVSEDALDDGVDAEDAIRSALRFLRDIGTAKLRTGTLSLFRCNFTSLRVNFGLMLMHVPLLNMLIVFTGVLLFRIGELASRVKMVSSLVLMNDGNAHEGESYRNIGLISIIYLLSHEGSCDRKRRGIVSAVWNSVGGSFSLVINQIR